MAHSYVAYEGAEVEGADEASLPELAAVGDTLSGPGQRLSFRNTTSASSAPGAEADDQRG
jgi:hypothetical protein